MKNNTKSLWVKFTKLFGRTVIHPQYIKKKLEYKAISEIKKYASGDLIDIGCGRMPYRDELEPRLKKYIGVDHPKISKLYVSDRKPDVLADASKLPFSSESFDIAISLQVLEYIEDPQKVFQEISRVLKQKGILVLTVPFLYPLHDLPLDRARYTQSALRDFATKANFKVIRLVDNGGFVEFYAQSLLVFIFIRVKEILAKKITPMSAIYLLVLGASAPFIVLLSNCMVVILQPIKKMLPDYTNYFPLDFLLIAQKR